MLQEKNLVKDHGKIDGTESDDDSLHHSIFAVHAQENRAERNDRKLPDPEIGAVNVHSGLDDWVCFPSFRIEDHHCKERVENVQPQDQDEKKENRRTMPVGVGAFPLVFEPSYTLSPPQENVAAERRSGLSSAIP